MTVQGTSLNPADVASGGGTNVPILSNANLTLTGQGGSNNFMSIRAVGGATVGLFYFQCTVTSVGGFSPGIGVVASAASLDAFGATGALWPGGMVWLNDGRVFLNGAQVATWQTYGDGAVLCFSVNINTGRIWGRVGTNGIWNFNFNASPVFGVGGVDISVFGASLKPVAWMNDFGGSASRVTFDFSFADTLPPPSPINCLAWARAIHIPAAGNPIPGEWTNAGNVDAPAVPDIGYVRGGMSFASPTLPGEPVYLTASGSGDASIKLLAQSGLAPPPVGYYPGWPGSFGAGLFDGLNPATAQGSASLIGNNPSLVQFPASPGIMQGFTGVRFGAYYFEYVINGYDIFSTKAGIGVGRLGVGLPEWFNAGGFSSTDGNGGAQIDGGNITNSFQASLGVNNLGYLGLPRFLTGQGQGVGVAVLITDSFPPFLYNPQQLQPSPMVCTPCVELMIGRNGRFMNRFGH